MSSISPSGLSNISENTLQTRYEKALKQINKLIQMNRQLKEAITNYEEQNQQLKTALEQTEKANRQFDEQNSIMQTKYMQLQQHYREIQDYCSQLQSKLQNQEMGHVFEEKLREAEIKYQEQLETEIMKNGQLTRQIQMLNQMYQQSITTLQQQCQKTSTLLNANNELQIRTTQLSQQKEELSNFVKDKNIEDLQGKLEKANITIEKLMRECNEMKGRQIDIEVMDEKKRVQKAIGFGSVMPQQSQVVKILIGEYKSKCKVLEGEKKEIEKKYRNLKNNTSRRVPEESYLYKIASLESLTERQQSQMARLIEVYDQQLHSLAFQHQRIKGSYQSMGEELTKMSMDLSSKEKELIQLRYTASKGNCQQQAVRKGNNPMLRTSLNKPKALDLVGVQTPILRQYTSLDTELSSQLLQGGSYTVIDKLPNQETVKGYKQGNMKKKQGQEKVSPVVHANPTNSKTSFKSQTSFKSNQQKPNQITLNYPGHSPDSSDFKFIQSVNIINGYNVSLGQNTKK